MNKSDFLSSLSEKLSTLPQNELQKSLDYYSEIIEDRIEEGMSEDEAVAALGDMNIIAKNILLETPLPTLIKAKIKPRHTLKFWEIILIILGFPVWFPLIIAFFAIVFSLYIAVWSVIISLWAAVLSIALCGLCEMCIRDSNIFR